MFSHLAITLMCQLYAIMTQMRDSLENDFTAR
jgi:hypothetical protein